MKFFKVYKVVDVPKERQDDTPADRCMGVFKNKTNADGCAMYLGQKYDCRFMVLYGELLEMDYYYITHKVVKYSDCKEEILKLTDEHNHTKTF